MSICVLLYILTVSSQYLFSLITKYLPAHTVQSTEYSWGNKQKYHTWKYNQQSTVIITQARLISKLNFWFLIAWELENSKQSVLPCVSFQDMVGIISSVLHFKVFCFKLSYISICFAQPKHLSEACTPSTQCSISRINLPGHNTHLELMNFTVDVKMLQF